MNTFIKYSDDGDKRQILDAETGEILHDQKKQELWIQDGERAYIYNQEKVERRKKTPHFIRLHRINWCDLVRRNILTRSEIALVASLLAFLDWESNYIIDDETKQFFNETSLAKALHYDKKGLRIQLEKLEDKGIIFIDRPGKGRANKYLINPNIAFWGKEVKNYIEHDKFNDAEYRPKSPIKPMLKEDE